MFSTLRAKIFAGYLGILVLLAGLGGYAIYSFRSLNEITARGLELNAQTTLANLSIYASLSRVNEGTLAFVNNGGTAATNLIAGQSHEFYDALQRMQRFISSESGAAGATISETLTRIEIAWQQYEALLRQLYAYYSNSPEEARTFYETIMTPAYNELVSLIFDLTEKNVNAFNDLRTETAAKSKSAIIGIIMVAAIALLVGGIASYALARKVTSPLGALRENLQELRAGNLSARVPVVGTDEIGDVSFEFNRLVERLDEYERMNINEILREKQKSEAIISSIDDPLFLFDTDWRLLLANQAASRIVNRRLTEGSSIQEAYGDEHLVSLIEQVAGEPRTRDGLPLIISIYLNGKPRYYKVGVLQLSAPEQGVGGFLVVFTDITHFKELDELRSDFIAKVSHEFRTPLTSMKIALDLLSRTTTGAINQDQHELIETTKNDADRLDKLIKDLLAVARLETSRLERGDEIHTDAAKVFDDVIGSLRRQFDAKNVRLSAERIVAPAELRIRRTHIESVLQNLLSNALKFTPSGGEVEAAMEYALDSSMLTIRVSDTGIGIPKEDQERIFEKFVQIKPHDSATPGSVGLGLSIVSEIARQYGGMVSVMSEKGQGSTFTVIMNVST